VARSYEKSLMFYQAARRDNSKDSDLQGCYSVKTDWNCCLLRNLARHTIKTCYHLCALTDVLCQ